MPLLRAIAVAGTTILGFALLAALNGHEISFIIYILTPLLTGGVSTIPEEL